MSDTFYSNDDIMQEIDDLHGKVDNINEQLGLMMKFMEGLQAQLGNEVDSLAKLTKLEDANFGKAMNAFEKLTIRKGA